MNKYQADRIHERLDHIRYYYTHTETCPRTFETWSFPIAAYDREGVIHRANKMFREFAGISGDDIRCGVTRWYHQW